MAMKQIYHVDKDELYQLYVVEGLDIKDIAERLGVTSRLISSRIKKFGFCHQKKEKYSYVTREVLENLYVTNGLSVQQCASKLNAPYDTIVLRLKRYNIPLRHRGSEYDWITKDLLINLYYNRGLTCKEISGQLNASVSTIQKRMNKYGIEKRVLSRRKMDESLRDTYYNKYIVEGKTGKQIALELGITLGKVRRDLYKFKIKRDKIGDSVTKEELYNLYIKQDKTIAEVCSYLGISGKVIKRKLSEFKIKKEKKYSFLTEELLRELYLNKNLYITEIAEELSVPFNVISYWIKAYGLEKEKTEDAKLECHKRAQVKAFENIEVYPRSKAEDEISEIYEGAILNNREAIEMELDLWYPDKRVAIEYNGDYWHSDKNRRPKHHILKEGLCSFKGIKLVTIFERFWRIKKQKRKILNILNNIFVPSSLSQIKGDIKDASNTQKEFENENNINGYFKSSYCIGVFDESKVVSTLSYDIKEGKCIINRFTSRIGYVEDYKILLDSLKERFNTIQVICDKRYYNGDLFAYEGFKQIGCKEADYVYVYGTTEISKEKYKNEKCKTKYSKVYDCGYSVWEWTKNNPPN